MDLRGLRFWPCVISTCVAYPVVVYQVEGKARKPGHNSVQFRPGHRVNEKQPRPLWPVRCGELTVRKAIEIGFIVTLVTAAISLVPGLAGSNGFLDFGPAVAQAQNTQPVGTGYKTLVVMPGGLMSPLFITKVSVGNKAMLLGSLPSKLPPNQISNGRPFQDCDNWLSRMTIYIKNRTDKTVAWVGLELLFPKPGSGAWGLIAIQTIQLGRVPAVDMSTIRTVDGKPVHFSPSLKPLDLRPGQEVTVRVSDYMNSIKQLVQRFMPAMMVTKLQVEIGSCYFNDGMRWSTGVYSALDKAHPGKMKNLPSNYFPGNPRQYWPPGL